MIDLNGAVDNHAVGRNFIAGLQQNAIAHDDVVDRNFGNRAVAIDFAFDERRLRLQRLEGTFVFVLGKGRYAGRENDCERDADRLVPLGLAHEREEDVQREREDQNFDDRIVEIALEFIPKALASLFRDAVIAVSRL